MLLAKNLHHDVFISYATVASAQIGAALERGLVTFGKQWDSPAALNVFRDVSDQPATPDLATELMAHLDASDWLIYLASPEAANSRWVQAEITHWIKTRGRYHLLIGIGSGVIDWDPRASRFAASTTCLPPELIASTSMPKWVDFREAASGKFNANDDWFRDKIADFSSKIRGIPKDRLVSLHWREHRKGLARRVAQHAELMVETDVGLALQFAAAANELDDVPETRSTLSRLLEHSSGTSCVDGPHGTVTAMALCQTPGCVVLGHADGVIDLLATGEPTGHTSLACPRPGHQPSALAVSGDGFAAGYLDGFIACRSRNVERISKVMDESVLRVAIDEDLTHVACASQNRVVVFTVETGELHEVPSDLTALAMKWRGANLWICGWADLLSYNAADGQLTRQGSVPFLPRPGPRAINGEFDKMAVAQLDGGGVTVWSVPEKSSSDLGFFQAPPGFMDALAIDSTGEHAAVATGGRLIVWALSSPESPALDQQGLPPGLGELLVGDAGSWVLARGADKCELRVKASSTLTRHVPLETLEVPSVVQAAIAVAFSPDSQLVAWVTNPIGPHRTTSNRPSISIWEVSGWRPGPSLDLSTVPIGLAFTETGKLLVESYEDASRIWDLKTLGTQVSDLSVVSGLKAQLKSDPPSVAIYDGDELVDEIVWSGKDWPTADMVPAGRLAPVAFRSGRLLLRDVEARTDLWSVNTATFSAVACSPDERIVAGVTQGGRLLLIDAPSGGIMARLQVPASPLHKLAFAPSGLLLASAGVGGALTLINTDISSWRHTAQIRAGGRLSSTERERLGLDQMYLH